jgi:nitronate monooxygenase
MWPDHRLIDLFGTEHPLVLAPMAGLGTVELAAAVCEAGGLGSIGCGPAPPEATARMIGELRALTRKPFNVNFFCHAPARTDAARQQAWRDRLSPFRRELGIGPTPSPAISDIAPFGDAMCRVVEAVRPEVVSFHFGLPDAALLARVKAAGCRVISSATTVEEAVWLETHGVDAVIAQGYEAGGHRGTFLAEDVGRAVAAQLGTLALVPQVVDAVRVPVVAAGGVADGRGIAAALTLGAAAVQLGTAYLLCPEAATPPLHREALRSARHAATLVTNVFTGRPARALVNRLAREVGPICDAMPDFPLAMADVALLRATAEQQGNSDFTPLWSGQSAPLAREMPARMLTLQLVQDAIRRLGN